MKITLSFIFSICFFLGYSQEEPGFIRKGNQAYNDSNYAEAESFYRKALQKDPKSARGYFNLGDALYKQGKLDEATENFNTSIALTDKKDAADAFYNLGTSLLKNKKLDESIEAFKNALRINPSHKDARYNLSNAIRQKQEQQKNQQQKQDKEKQDKDEKKDKEKQDNKEDGEKQDQQDQGEKQDQQDGEKPGEKNKPDEKPGDEEDETVGKLTREEAQRLLKALENEEEKIQKRMLLKKGKGKEKNIEKDW